MIKLNRNIEKPLIIEGFPGFGLIGAIASEFLISHLRTELIGEILMDEMPATLAIHKGKLVHPVGIYYNEKYNLMIIHSITPAQGLEWKIGRKIVELAKQVNAWEIISIEGVGSPQPSEASRVFFYSSKEENAKKLKEIGLERLNEGIIVGVTSALMIYAHDMNLTSLFAEAHMELPDSKAAAKVIEILDKYLGLEVDYNPLLKTAEEFEEQIKGILQQSQKAVSDVDKKAMSYVG